MVPICIRLVASAVSRHEYQQYSKHFLVFILKLVRIETLNRKLQYKRFTVTCQYYVNVVLVIMDVNLVYLYKYNREMACSCTRCQRGSCYTSFQSRICILLPNNNVIPCYILKQLNCPSVPLRYLTTPHLLQGILD
jgi:hypothetical protein